MGKVKRVLAECKLPERDDHNSRMFVDAAENIHFHYREFRQVFSVEEFLQFAKAIEQGRDTLKIMVEEGYKECMEKKDQVKGKIIGGSQSKKLDIPNPKKSAYFDDRLIIEEQAKEIDMIHIHYRDHRIAIDNEETFLKFCDTVGRAKCEWLKSRT